MEKLFRVKTEISKNGDFIAIFTILSTIIDGHLARQLNDEWLKLVDVGVEHFVFVFGDMHRSNGNSKGFGLMIKALEELEKNGATVKFANFSKTWLRLLDMLGILGLFEVYATEKEAITAIHNRPSNITYKTVELNFQCETSSYYDRTATSQKKNRR